MDAALKTNLETAVTRFLVRLEDLFGPRDPRFPSVYAERWSDPRKSPCPMFFEREERAIIYISAYVTSRGALWEVAHECVHLLDPWMEEVEGKPTSVLEEGFATWFQNSWSQGDKGEVGPAYQEAERLVRPYMGDLPDAIKYLRSQGIRIGEIEPAHLRGAYPKMASSRVERLCQRWAG